MCGCAASCRLRPDRWVYPSSSTRGRLGRSRKPARRSRAAGRHPWHEPRSEASSTGLGSFPGHRESGRALEMHCPSGGRRSETHGSQGPCSGSRHCREHDPVSVSWSFPPFDCSSRTARARPASGRWTMSRRVPDSPPLEPALCTRHLTCPFAGQRCFEPQFDGA
jgi:hypothetical protein